MTASPAHTGPPAGVPALVVDPVGVAAESGPLLAAARAVGAAVGSLDPAWGAAAAGLAEQRTGQALAAFRTLGRDWVRDCEHSLSTLGLALQQAGRLYAAADAGALPGPPPGRS